MSAKLLPVIRQRYFDSNGDPLVGGKFYTYVAGTTTPAATYSDLAGSTPNTNPVILDANGEANIRLGSGSYKVILADADDVVQWTEDDVSVEDSSGDLTSPWISHAVTDGQSASDLTSETVDLATYSSSVWDVEIIRGTTVFSNIPGGVAIQNFNGTARVCTGMALAKEAHGVTFSVLQTGMVAQLKAALSTGPGGGTIKLYRRPIPI